MVHVVAIANQKGGVGKTALTLGLASAARAAGQRVLVVDLDPQANSSDVLAADPAAVPGAVGLLADTRRGGGADLPAATATSTWGSAVDVVPATPALAEVDVDIAPAQPLRLAKALTAANGALDRYDLVLLDCPPGLGRLLVAGLVAASHVLAVTEPAAHATRGVAQLEATAAEVRDGFAQNGPQLVGIVVNRVKHTGEHAFREDELRAAYGDLVLEATVPERIAVADAVGRGIAVHDSTSRGAADAAAALDALWTQLGERLPTPAAATTSRSSA